MCKLALDIVEEDESAFLQYFVGVKSRPFQRRSLGTRSSDGEFVLVLVSWEHRIMKHQDVRPRHSSMRRKSLSYTSDVGLPNGPGRQNLNVEGFQRRNIGFGHWPVHI